MLAPSPRAVLFRRAFIVVYALLLTLGLTWPLLFPGFYEQHEGFSYVIRLEALAEGWRTQGVHPRWTPEFAAGHGYPLFNYYSPGFSYLAIPLHPLGALWAVKLTVVLGTLLGILCVFGLGRSLSGFSGGVVAATLAATAPYTLCNLHSRGDFSEYLAFFAAAGVLWALLAALRRGMPHWSALVFAAAYGGFVPLHTISSLVYSVLFALFAGAYALKARFDTRRWLSLIGAFALGLALSAWYWLPALAEKHLVSTQNMLDGYFAIESNFAQLPRYFIGISRSQPIVGPVTTGAALFVVVVALRRTRRRFLPLTCATLALVCMLLNFSISEPFWQHVPLVRYLQFPWRLNGPAVLLVAAGVSATIGRLPRKLRRTPLLAGSLVMAIAVVLALAVSLGKIVWLEPAPGEMQASASRWTTTSGRDEFLPTDADSDGVAPDAPLVLTPAQVLASGMEGTRIAATVDASTDSPVSIRQWAFPGWHAYVDGVETAWRPDSVGRISVIAPAGKHEIRVELRRTAAQQAAEWTSAIAAAIVLLAGTRLVIRKRKCRAPKENP